MKSPKDKERYRLWRKNNPDMVREQRKRRILRKKGLLAAWVKPEPPTEEQISEKAAERRKREYLKRKERIATDPAYAAEFRRKERERGAKRYAKLKSNPDALAEKLKRERERKAAAGKGPKPKKPPMTRAEHNAKRNEKRKLELRREHGLPDDYVFTRKAESKPKPLTIAQERQKRALEVANAMASMGSCSGAVFISPDPPELQRLFQKASRGLPPKNIYSDSKKMGAITARLKWM